MDFATHEASELYHYATSDRESYDRHLLPAYQNLERKLRRDAFDRLLAMKLLTTYTLTSIAKRYCQEFASPGQEWHSLFPPHVRQEVASHLVERLVDEIEIGNSYLQGR